MPKVNTVSGEVAVDQLGVTYMHEHIFIVNPEMQYHWPGYQGWDEDKVIEQSRGALRRLHDEYGVDTVLDPTVPGLGRNIRAVSRVLEGTGLQVVATTGWYMFNELPFTFHAKDTAGKAAELEALFMRDVEEGMDGTSIKPGAIKCTTDSYGVTPDVEALLRASARVHVKSGLPITTHTDCRNQGGLMQQQIFQEEDVDLGAVVIGHCNQSDDLAYMEKLIDNGSYIGFDRCGIESPVANFDQQLDNLAELCRRGYADRVVLSHDNMCYIDLRPPGLTVNRDDRGPDFPYGTIYNRTLPGLRERGVSESDINTMLVENPKAYFSRGR
jgi:phosphotriesterase-related protein